MTIASGGGAGGVGGKEVARLAAIGISETEANLRNKISRGGFTGAFLIQ